jgi:hypothetical protein
VNLLLKPGSCEDTEEAFYQIHPGRVGFDLADPCQDASVGDVIESTAWGAAGGSLFGPLALYGPEIASMSQTNAVNVFVAEQSASILWNVGVSTADKLDLVHRQRSKRHTNCFC